MHLRRPIGFKCVDLLAKPQLIPFPLDQTGVQVHEFSMKDFTRRFQRHLSLQRRPEAPEAD